MSFELTPNRPISSGWLFYLTYTLLLAAAQLNSSLCGLEALRDHKKLKSSLLNGTASWVSIGEAATRRIREEY
jgi:hypothetical protein